MSLLQKLMPWQSLPFLKQACILEQDDVVSFYVFCHHYAQANAPVVTSSTTGELMLLHYGNISTTSAHYTDAILGYSRFLEWFSAGPVTGGAPQQRSSSKSHKQASGMEHQCNTQRALQDLVWSGSWSETGAGYSAAYFAHVPAPIAFPNIHHVPA